MQYPNTVRNSPRPEGTLTDTHALLLNFVLSGNTPKTRKMEVGSLEVLLMSFPPADPDLGKKQGLHPALLDANQESFP